MSLFTSEIVKNEMLQANELYKEISLKMPTIMNASKEDKIELFDKLTRLIDIQEIIYTRIHLMEGDDDADLLKENFRMAAKQMGLPPVQINAGLFEKAREAIDAMRSSNEIGLVDTD